MVLLRLLNAALLLFLSSPASAESVLLSRSASGGEFFVERETIMDLGDQVYVKMLVNFPTVQDTGELSSISDTIVLCPSLTLKDTRLRAYADKSGKGAQLSDHDLVRYELDFWRVPPRGSTEHLFLRSLCRALGKLSD